MIRRNRSTYQAPSGRWRGVFVFACSCLLIITIGSDFQVSVGKSLMPIPYPGNKSIELPGSILPANCDRLGWYPTDFGLKDHSVFTFDQYYYIVSISTPDDSLFAYARSTDLCNWEDLGGVLEERIPGEWDDTAVWAPFVREENGVYFMYYTGLKHDYTQSILLATSTNPADPLSWQPQGMIFQPDHPGSLWQAGNWADCRDASVLKSGEMYYMVYTSLDSAGPIVGLATSSFPAGPWFDWGAIIILPIPETMPESPFITTYAGFYYLLYNNTSSGEEYRIGPTLAGPWSEAYSLPPGWANEMWTGLDGLDYTSFLQGYEIVIDRFIWDSFYHPARIFVGANVYRLYIPSLLKQDSQ